MLRTVHFFVQGSTVCRPLWNNSSHVPWQSRICLRQRGRENVSKKEMLGIDKSEGPGEKNTVTLHQHFILSLASSLCLLSWNKSTSALRCFLIMPTWMYFVSFVLGFTTLKKCCIFWPTLCNFGHGFAIGDNFGNLIVGQNWQSF